MLFLLKYQLVIITQKEYQRVLNNETELEHLVNEKLIKVYKPWQTLISYLLIINCINK